MEKANPFYSKGLRFECTRCSKCCRFTPGFVFLSNKDLGRIARTLKTSVSDVQDRFCRVVKIGEIRKLSLVEKSNLDCIFWENDKCTIYEGRPLQCRSYPFWSSNLYSQSAWDNAARSCPGIGHGQLHSQTTIEYWLKEREAENLIALSDERSIV
jgi:Fe-S-cluster containining protein